MSKVVISDCNEYNLNSWTRSSMQVLLFWAVGRSMYLRGMKVLSRSTSSVPSPETAAITHPEFVRALVRILKGLGCAVWIGDSSRRGHCGNCPTARSLKVSGLEQVAREEGAEIKTSIGKAGG